MQELNFLNVLVYVYDFLLLFALCVLMRLLYYSMNEYYQYDWTYVCKFVMYGNLNEIVLIRSYSNVLN
jgi:hypothetical protein